MGTRQQNVRVTRIGRFVRGLRPDRNPVRRASDRVEAAVLVMLVIAFIAGAPFTALATGGWALANAHHAQLSQEASSHQVAALVLKVSSQVQGDAGYAAGVSQAQVRWTAPDGKVATGETPVSIGTAAGATVRLWTTNDGQITVAPLQDSQVTDQAYFAGVFGVIALAVLLAIIGLLARSEMTRRRMAAWDAEWRATGPRWTTRA